MIQKHLLIHARIYTNNPYQPSASALIIQGGRILAVGTNEEILSLAQAGDQIDDMEGAVVWPGFTDAHMHLMYYALSLREVDCETRTRQECLERVAGRAAQTPPGEWIIGHGWDQNQWPEGYGTAALLDTFSGDYPIFLSAKSLHAAWLNSRALQYTGITRNPNIPSQFIQLASDGQPTGILFETAAMTAQKTIPLPSLDTLIQNIKAAQEQLARLGITGVHDFDGSLCFSALECLDVNNELALRVVKSIPRENLDAALATGLRSGFGSDHLRIGSLKLFADGALGPQTAAMLEPYEGSQSNQGQLLLDEEEIINTGMKAGRGGICLAVHAIGDRANHEVLSAYRKLNILFEQEKFPRMRHRLEHAQLLSQDDLLALSMPNMIVSMQPYHLISDMDTAERYWGDRCQHAFAWKDIQNAGLPLLFGSDAPVEIPNPFWGLSASVTRQKKDGFPGPQGWYPGQRIRLAEAVNNYTHAPAAAAGWGDDLGKLAPGYFADLITLPRDPFAIPAREIYDLQPVRTMFNGNWIWHA
jgi:predicted amidohydrolase YtcJ